jgi:hypothetical protein
MLREVRNLSDSVDSGRHCSRVPSHGVAASAPRSRSATPAARAARVLTAKSKWLRHFEDTGGLA